LPRSESRTEAAKARGTSDRRSISRSGLCVARSDTLHGPLLGRRRKPVALWWKHDKDSSVVTTAGQTSLRAEELVLDGDGVVIDYPVVWELAEDGRADAQLGGAGDCVGPGGWPPSSPLLLVRSVCSRNGRIRSIGAGKMIVEELAPPISSNVCR